MKSKFPDSIGTVHDEDNGLTWEANSSRCSTSQASETSATSGVFSLENSYLDLPSEMDEKFDQKRTSNSPNQEPLSPNGKLDPDNDYSVRQLQEKVEDIELDLANPKSWPYQVQPSKKIKDYLVQITQEVVPSLPEEKDNALKKKGELPLEGTVRARIQLITAVLEERNKKIFRRVNKKDVPPPPPVPIIRRSREPPKIFSRQGIFVPLKHVEREDTEKKNKKEPVRYNLKPVQTNAPKAGVSVPYNTTEKRTRRSFLSETQNKISEKPETILPPLADQAYKSDTKPYSRLKEASFASTGKLCFNKMEKKESYSILPDKGILEKGDNFLDETKKPELQHDVPVVTEVTDISEDTERTTAKPILLATVKPLSDSTNETQNLSISTVTVPSSHHDPEQIVLAEKKNQGIELHPSQPAIKNAAVLHFAEETGKEDIFPYPPAVAESTPEQFELSHLVRDTEKQEIRQVEVEYSKEEGEQSTQILKAEPEHQHLVHSGKEEVAREKETVVDLPPSAGRTETQESQNYPYKAAEEYSGPPQPTELMGEAEKIKKQLQFNLAKEDVETPTTLTSAKEPEFVEESHLKGDKEDQTVPVESQPPDLSLSSPEAQREEIHQHSTAITQPEIEHPVITEPVKAPPRSKHGKSSQLGGKEASSHSPAEAVDSSEKLPFISSSLTESVEKEETRPSALITATPLLKDQPSSDLPDQTEQMEKHDSALYSPETPTLVSDVSLSAVPVQPPDSVKVEVEQYSPTQAPSEASVSVSRESDVAVERETIQPDSLLCIESPPETSVSFQEAMKSENQVYPPINTKLYSEDEEGTHPYGDEGQQDGDVHLLGTAKFEWKSSAESEVRKQNIKENSALCQLEETIALHSVDEAEKKDMHPDKSIPKPSHSDSLYPISVPEKQERMHSEMGQTSQSLSSAVLQTESDILPSVKEMDGVQVCSPAAIQDVSKPACFTETLEDKDLPTETATPHSEPLGIQSNIVGGELVSKHRAKHIIQPITTELEPDYPKMLFSVSESDFETSFPAPRGDFQSHVIMTQQSEDECPDPSEKEREKNEQCSSTVPASELKIPTAGPETQESLNYTSDALPEVSKSPPIISSFLPVQIKDQELSSESILSSISPSEQLNLQSLDLKDKSDTEKSQLPFPEMPKTGPQESLSTTTFPIGETVDEAPYSPRDTQIVPEELKSVTKDFASEGIQEMDLPPSPLPAGSFSEESISLCAVNGEKQEHSHALLTAESRQLDSGKTDMCAVLSHPIATAQSETKDQDIKPYCPVVAQSEQEDLALLSGEVIMKQETPLHSFSMVESEPIGQELLHDVGKRGDQEKSPLETDVSKTPKALLQSPIQQQVSEHLNLLQSVKQSEMKEIQPSSFATAHDSSQLATETETRICQGSLSKTAENDYGVSKLSENPEIQPLWREAAQLEYQQSVESAKETEQISFPPVTAPLDQVHVSLFSSTEPQLSSPEAQDQISENPPSVSPLTREEIKKQGANSCFPSVSISSTLGLSNSVQPDHIEETEQQEIQSHPPAVENVMPEEPFSIAAFLLSEAKEIQTTFPLTTEKDHLDVHPQFEEAGLLIERSGSDDQNGTIKKETQPSPIHSESQQLSSKPQAEVTDLEKRENIPETPTTKQPSDAFLSEPINESQTQNMSTLISSVDSDKIKGKKPAVITEDLSKTENVPCLLSANKYLQESENHLQKEKELNNWEKLSEESISTPDSFSTSEDYQADSVLAPPFISSADEEENKHTPERLEYLEIVSSLETKPFHEVEDETHETSVHNLCMNILEGLTEDIRENKANESKEMVGEMMVQRKVEIEKEASACPEKKNDNVLNVTGMDYFEKYTLIDDKSFTQTGKEQSVEVVQRLIDNTKENFEETTVPPVSSKNTLDVSILERDLDEDFHKMEKRENTAAAKDQETPDISKEDELIDAVGKTNKNKEDELNLAGASLCSTEDVVVHSLLTPMQDLTLNPELLQMPPALSSLYKDFYEEVMAKPNNDSFKHTSTSEETVETNEPLHNRVQVTNDGARIYLEKDIPKEGISNDTEEFQKEQIIKKEPVNKQALNQIRVSQGGHEPNEIVKGTNDALLEGPIEIVSDIKVTTCQPALAVPFGSGLYSSGASNDENSQSRGDDSLSAETDHILPEETSDEESSPILDYAATMYPEEASVQDETMDATCLTADQPQQSKVTEVQKVDNYIVTKPVEESTQLDETLHQRGTPWENEEPVEDHFKSVVTAQETHALDYEHPIHWEAEERENEHVFDLVATNREAARQQYAAPEVKSDSTFGELDYSLFSHDFDIYPLYSIKEEESDLDEDLAELMDYEMVTQEDVFREETASEVAREDDRKSVDRISNTYEFVNERDADAYTEEEEFELMGLEKLPKNVPESEVLQKETEQAEFDAYCYQCKCLICADDKHLGDHKEHHVTNLDTAATELKVSKLLLCILITIELRLPY